MPKLICYLSLIIVFFLQGCNGNKQNEKPNILWITCEDISPYLGSYGCKEALTPNLDRLAANGIRYTHAYANAPVCAVARSTILSGMHACTIGTHQMRSRIQLPEDIPAYPKILREAGYYCTNNSKKDYNSNYTTDTTLWNESSNTAHYKNRKPGQPFFAVFNNVVTHESQLNQERIQQYIEEGQIPGKPRVNPTAIDLPPFHPDLPDIREDWARLHDLITLMDSMSGNLLNELEAEGLADNTIVFFYSDHGGMLSRTKRYIYNVGTQVPMLVYLPPKWQHLAIQKPGETDDSMVSFVDLAKTTLSLAGCEIPKPMQGHVFLGEKKETSPQQVYFYRDRMGERYDFSRAVTDGQFYFIRNFMPHRPLGRDSRYGYTVQANWRAWEKHFEAGNCNDVQSQFYMPKPVVALFNTNNDPWHVANLAQNEQYQQQLNKLSDKLDEWMIETRDIGLIPEPMFFEIAGEGKKYKTLYEYAQSNEYPIRRVLEAAKQSSSATSENIQTCLSYLNNDNPIIRYWGAYGLFLAHSSNQSVKQALKAMMHNDQFAANRIIAAQALSLFGDKNLVFQSIFKEVSETKDSYVFLFGLNAFQYSHTDSLLTKNDWQSFKERSFLKKEGVNEFGEVYAQRLISDALELWPERRKVY